MEKVGRQYRSREEFEGKALAIVTAVFLFLGYYATALPVFKITTIVELGIYCLLFCILLVAFRTKIMDIRYVQVFFIIVVMILWNNHSLQNGIQIRAMYLIMAVFLALVLQLSDTWMEGAIKQVVFFSMVHMITGWIFLVLPQVYLNKIVPLFPEHTAALVAYQAKNILIGFTTHYTTSGIYCSIGCISAFALLVHNEKKKWSFLYLIFSAVSLLMTQKRGPLFATVLTLAIMYVVHYRFTIKTVLTGVCSLGGFLGMYFLLANTILPQLGGIALRFSYISQNLKSGVDATNGRMPMYQLAWNLFEENPLFGIGWDGFRYEYQQQLSTSLDRYQKLDTHNIYLQLLCENGLIGFMLIGAVLFFMIKEALALYRILNNPMAREQYRDCKYILFSIGIQSYFLIYGVTGNSLYDKQILFPFALACGILMAVRGKYFKKKWRLGKNESGKVKKKVSS